MDCVRSLGVRSTAIWCALCPPDTVEHRSSYGTSVRGPDHVITDWPISDHTCKVVSKMSLLTSLLTTCEICE
ncbi:unnamed protein product [Staurois parvus]|uniref:Uncharacterized protein n=1 Tax=Staurois parvus TaxID=386267 RepID=A0ABN9BY10_9NEOB|nr:unnamed protein product [Staurois parvus]